MPSIPSKVSLSGLPHHQSTTSQSVTWSLCSSYYRATPSCSCTPCPAFLQSAALVEVMLLHGTQSPRLLPNMCCIAQQIRIVSHLAPTPFSIKQSPTPPVTVAVAWLAPDTACCTPQLPHCPCWSLFLLSRMGRLACTQSSSSSSAMQCAERSIEVPTILSSQQYDDS
jgi:hypothetical protein